MEGDILSTGAQGKSPVDLVLVPRWNMPHEAVFFSLYLFLYPQNLQEYPVHSRCATYICPMSEYVNEETEQVPWTLGLEIPTLWSSPSSHRGTSADPHLIKSSVVLGNVLPAPLPTESSSVLRVLSCPGKQAKSVPLPSVVGTMGLAGGQPRAALLSPCATSDWYIPTLPKPQRKTGELLSDQPFCTSRFFQSNERLQTILKSREPTKLRIARFSKSRYKTSS